MYERWRDEEPTTSQLDYIHKLRKHYKIKEFELPETKGEAADLIDSLKAKISQQEEENAD